MADKEETAFRAATRNAGTPHRPNVENERLAHHDINFHERWLRVTPRSRCPICNHADWCMFSPDGAIGGCMRISSGAFKTSQTRGGDMYIHRLRHECAPAARIRPQKREPVAGPAVASVDYRHAVYSALLDQWVLTPDHAHYLITEKRISHETVTRNLYATVPDGQTIRATLSHLSRDFELSLVPGFYRRRGSPQLIARPGELLIPIRDHRERIVALSRRTGGDPKYKFLSGRGVSSGAPMHYALPYLANLNGDVIITEGALKADVIAEHLHCATIGISGVAAFQDGFGHELRALLQGVKFAYLAFDADERRNGHVRSALIRLIISLHAAGYLPEILQWEESHGKGLDDVLTGGGAS
jgi:DNA primase